MRLILYSFLLIAVGMVISACDDNSIDTASLPLSEGELTFFFFYTDN